MRGLGEVERGRRRGCYRASGTAPHGLSFRGATGAQSGGRKERETRRQKDGSKEILREQKENKKNKKERTHKKRNLERDSQKWGEEGAVRE